MDIDYLIYGYRQLWISTTGIPDIHNSSCWYQKLQNVNSAFHAEVYLKL